MKNVFVLGVKVNVFVVIFFKNIIILNYHETKNNLILLVHKIVIAKNFNLFHVDLKKSDNGGYLEEKISMFNFGELNALVNIRMKNINQIVQQNVQNVLALHFNPILLAYHAIKNLKIMKH